MDFEDTLFRDGRLTPRARNRWPTVTVAGIDFEALHQAVSTRLAEALLSHDPLFNQYSGNYAEVTEAIRHGIDQLLNQAMNELWNRLRRIAETYSQPTKANIFERKAPSMYRFELPSLIASMFSSIGPLDIEDDPFGARVVIYAPSYETRDYFGRKSLTVVDSLSLMRFIAALRAVNIPLGTIQQNLSIKKGAFFTTCSTQEIEDHRFAIYGSFHMSHYAITDVVMAMFFGKWGSANNPFQDLSFSVGFVDNEAIVDEIEKYFTLSNHGKHDSEPNEAIPVFQPHHLVAHNGGAPTYSNVTVPDRGKGVYIIGRGNTRVGHCSLARQLHSNQISMIIRNRILTSPAESAPAKWPREA